MRSYAWYLSSIYLYLYNCLYSIMLEQDIKKTLNFLQFFHFMISSSKWKTNKKDIDFSFKHTTLITIFPAICCWQPHFYIWLIKFQNWPNIRDFRLHSFDAPLNIKNSELIICLSLIDDDVEIQYLLESSKWEWKMVFLILSESFVYKNEYRDHIPGSFDHKLIPLRNHWPFIYPNHR